FQFGTDLSQSTGQEFFGGLESAAIINQEDTPDGSLTVIFEIDMSPAITEATTPFNPAEDSVFMQLESKFTALLLGVAPGGDFFDDATSPEDLEILQFKPVEGETNIYRLELDLVFPMINDFGFVIVYGQPFADAASLVDNGGGFDAGRRYYQFIQPEAVRDGGVDPFIGQIFEVDWPSSFQMARLTWQEDPPLPFETQPDYAALATSIDEVFTENPNQFRLEQNFPNPFNPSTVINFTLPQASEVKLNVYNVLGQRVATLVNGQLNSGTHSIRFDARSLASGVYFYRLEAGNFIQQKSMTLIK
ncbi:MAG: T9SS type A sorting domain-containing protein, partial [Balneolaceae bacterium]